MACVPASPARAAAVAVALALFVASSLPTAHGCSSFVVNCESDGAVVTVRTLDFSSDLVAATVSSAAGAF